MATNPYGQPESLDASNPYGKPETKPEGVLKGLGKSLKAGIQELPGMVTGLADIPVALATGARPFTALADAAGEVTGFQPGKWAKETQRSDEYKASQAEVGKTWEGVDKVSADKSASNLDYWKQLATDAPSIAGAYAKNPMYTANQVVQSLPGVVGGGVASKVIRGFGAAAGVGLSADAVAAGAMGPVRQAIPGYVERAVGGKWVAPVVAGASEGAVTAGQSMANAEGEDQQKNAVAALGAGVVTGLIGGIGGRLANSIGLETAGTAMAKAGDGTLGAGLSATKRILGGAITEGAFQELPQSVQEAMWQNYADGKPIMQGVARQGVEGALAGAAMGGAANIVNSTPVKAPVAPAPTPDAPPGAAPEGDPLQADNAIYPMRDAVDAGTGVSAQGAAVAPLSEGEANGLRRAAELDRRRATKEALGLDPAAGPLSSAAVVAVDTGAHQPAFDAAAAQATLQPMKMGHDQAETQAQFSARNKPEGSFITKAKQAKAQSTPQGESNGATDTPTGMAQGANEPTSSKPIGSGIAPLVQRDASGDGSGRVPAEADGQSAASRPMVDAGRSEAPVAPSGNSSTQEPDAPTKKEPENQPPALEPLAQEATETVAKEPAGREGYEKPFEVDAKALMAAFEKENGSALAWNNDKLNAVRGGAKSTGNIEAAINARGDIGINDGRHRIAVAAERGESVKVFASEEDGKAIMAKLTAPAPVTQPAQPVMGEGAGGSQPTQVAPPIKSTQGNTNVTQADQAIQGQAKQQAPERATGQQVTTAKTGLKGKMEQQRTARADYFTPGNIVKTYGGHDQIISYTPPKSDGGGWNVKARAVVQKDGQWIQDPKDNRERNHSTQPEARELANGPVQRAPQAEQTAAAPKNDAPASDHAGQGGKPIAEGGKPFKTKEAAAEAKKLQPMMRVVKAGKGFALAPKTEKQIAAQEAAARRLSIARTGTAGVPTAAHEFIAGEGGMDASTKNEFGFGNNPRVGNRTLFAGARGGMSLDAATEKLIEAGYLPEGATHSDTVALVNRSFTVPQHTADGTEVLAEAAMNQHFDDYLTAQEEAAQDDAFDPFDSVSDMDFTLDDAEWAGYDALEDPIKLEVDALLAQADALGIDTDTIKEGAHEDTRNGSEQDYYDATRDALTSAIEASNRSSNQDAGTPGNAGSEEGAVNSSQAPESNANVAPPIPGIYKLEDGQYARFQDGIWFRRMGTPREALKTEFPSYNTMAPKDRGDGDGWTPHSGFTLDAYGATRSLKPFSKSELATFEVGEQGLTAPTRAEVLAQQERADSATRSETAQRKAQELADKQARERKDIAKASEAAADTFVLGGDAEQNLSGQGSIFDEPAVPAPISKTETTAKPPKTPSAAELRAQADLQAALADLGDIFGENTRMNMMPEQEAKILPVMVKLFDAAFRLGYIKFKDAAKFALDKIRAALGSEIADDLTLEHLQGAYISMSSGKTGVDGIRAVSNIENKSEIEAHTAQTDNERNGESNAPSTDSRVERDSPVASTEPAMGDTVSPESTGADAATAEAGGRSNRGEGRGQQDSAGVPFGSAPVAGERSDQLVHSGVAKPELESIIAGTDFREPGGDSGITGVPAEPIAAGQVDAVADQRATGLKAGIERNRADKATVTLGDIDSIRATLPQLLPGQDTDVQIAEKRFAKPDGYGMLFTNGTGTGKTFSGLGLIKRQALQGKTNTLIVVPDGKIAADWIESGKLLGLDITSLKDTKDAGKGIVITTYANLGENDQLARRQWGLVVADEAHSLMQAATGDPTGYLYNLRALTYHPDGAHTRHNMLNRDKLDQQSALGEEILALEKMVASDSTTHAQRNDWEAKSEKLQDELGDLRKELAAAQEAMRQEVDARQGADRTRLVALSATPFAYEKTIDWANGYLFDYNEGQSDESREFRGYNSGSNKDRYMMQNFGYSMRYNKMTRPDANVDTGLMQRQWNANLKKSGALSGRMLDVTPDYDRRFILVESAIGNRIDEALEWVSEQQRAEKGSQGPYTALSTAINEKFKYLEKRYLLEAIKATEVIPIVKQHMAMGRKVVVFHDYKKGGGFNPFRVNSGIAGIGPALDAFNSQFKDLVNAPLGSMPSPIDVFSRELPEVLLINGDEKKADLLARYKSFQNDANGPQVMLVQSAKNKGWSGHDTTGKHQRVLINLGQPTAPTLAIQQEGRIYRTGQASDAIMRYMNTGTNWERWTFATTIASRASTAENLGMGEMARALKDSFIQSFEESDTYAPGHEGEGKGGKERDKAANDAITEFDRAKTFYFGQQKKTSKTKAQEGADYFATPEPVGLKMTQWLDARGGEDVLEPSGGHGAIARWIPDNTKRTVIEPSLALRSRLSMVMNPAEDRIISGTFEEHHIGNKYDGIVMNPPFGSGGRTAIDHLAQAATHLRDGGRIVALIPTGPAADKKFDKWFFDESEAPAKPLQTKTGMQKVYAGDSISFEGKTFIAKTTGRAPGSFSSSDYVTDGVTRAYHGEYTVTPGPRTANVKLAAGLHLIANVKLPQITFERAGTAVATRIVVIEKSDSNVMQRDRDLSDITDIKELFDQLENMDFPPRAKAVEAAPDEPVKPEKKAPVVKTVAPVAAIGDEIKLGDKSYPVTTYTTNAGKELRGVWASSKAEALNYGPSTFEKKGLGFFVRERDFPKVAAPTDAPALSRSKPVFSRGAQTQATESVETLVNAIVANWSNAPEIIVAFDMQDARIPERVRQEDLKQRSGGAAGTPEGFYYKGKVYLMSSQLNTANDVARVLFHETLGHYGLRGHFGGALKPILQQIVTMRQDAVNAKMQEYGLRSVSNMDRMTAAEEVLAEMAQNTPELGFVKRAIAAIRNWLRANVPGFSNMKLMDEDIISNFLIPARRYVTNNILPDARRGAGFTASNDKAEADKLISDSARSDAEMLANLTRSKSFIEKGFGGLDAPTKRGVELAVIRLAKNPKVFDSIVNLVPVNVVNMLGVEKITPDMLLNNPSVFENLLVINRNESVSVRGNAATQFVLATAMAAAKHVGIDLRLNLASWSPAKRAGEENTPSFYERTSTRNTTAISEFGAFGKVGGGNVEVGTTKGAFNGGQGSLQGSYDIIQPARAFVEKGAPKAGKSNAMLESIAKRESNLLDLLACLA